MDTHLATYDASSTVSGIDDRSIIAILVSAIKDLYAKMQEYFARTERLEERVSALEVQLAGSAAAGAPIVGAGAPDGPSALDEPNADAATTTTSSDSAPITSEAANDNQLNTDEIASPTENVVDNIPADGAAPQTSVVGEEAIAPAAANDNAPPPSAEAI